MGFRSILRLHSKSASPKKIQEKHETAPKIIHSNLLVQISEQIAATKRTLSKLAKSTKPILVGPWVGEVGFELLYWIPFLAWAKSSYSLPAEQLVVISRGGAAPWYQGFTRNYLDILDFVTPEVFRTKNEERWNLEGKKKQREVSGFENEILDWARSSLKETEVQVLHPSLMYEIFRLFWKKKARWRPSLTLLDSLLTFEKLPSPPPAGPAIRLPEEYVAVKFYFNESFPGTDENRALVSSAIRNVTRVLDVVVLSTGFHLDDHGEFEIEARSRVHFAEPWMTPRNNLEVQSHIISRASGFVGTYGGFSYLAPFYGVDSLSFYSAPEKFRHPHLHLAEELFSSNREFGAFQFLDVRGAEIARRAFSGGSDDHAGRKSSFV